MGEMKTFCSFIPQGMNDLIHVLSVKNQLSKTSHNTQKLKVMRA